MSHAGQRVDRATPQAGQWGHSTRHSPELAAARRADIAAFGSLAGKDIAAGSQASIVIVAMGDATRVRGTSLVSDGGANRLHMLGAHCALRGSVGRPATTNVFGRETGHNKRLGRETGYNKRETGYNKRETGHNRFLAPVARFADRPRQVHSTGCNNACAPFGSLTSKRLSRILVLRQGAILG